MQTQLNNVATTHNELVIDTRSVTHYLPSPILGFFYVAGTDPSDARRARNAFIAAFSLSEVSAPPLLQLDLDASSSPLSLG